MATMLLILSERGDEGPSCAYDGVLRIHLYLSICVSMCCSRRTARYIVPPINHVLLHTTLKIPVLLHQCLSHGLGLGIRSFQFIVPASP
jgi:hypothetical protein